MIIVFEPKVVSCGHFALKNSSGLFSINIWRLAFPRVFKKFELRATKQASFNGILDCFFSDFRNVIAHWHVKAWPKNILLNPKGKICSISRKLRFSKNFQWTIAIDADTVIIFDTLTISGCVFASFLFLFSRWAKHRWQHRLVNQLINSELLREINRVNCF